MISFLSVSFANAPIIITHTTTTDECPFGGGWNREYADMNQEQLHGLVGEITVDKNHMVLLRILGQQLLKMIDTGRPSLLALYNAIVDKKLLTDEQVSQLNRVFHVEAVSVVHLIPFIFCPLLPVSVLLGHVFVSSCTSRSLLSDTCGVCSRYSDRYPRPTWTTR